MGDFHSTTIKQASKMLTGSNKHVSSLAIVIGVACFLAVVVINAKYEEREALHNHELVQLAQGPDCDSAKDPEECIENHSDDDQLKKDTEHDDVKDGESVEGEKKTENAMAGTAEKDHVHVDHEVDKLKIREAKTKETLAKEEAEERSQMKEIFDLAYHAAMQKKREAKRAAAARKALAKKLADMKRAKREAVLEKIDCKELKTIYKNAQPRDQKFFDRVDCDKQEEIEILP